MESFDLANGPLEGAFEPAIDPAGGLFYLLRRDLELVRFQSGGVETTGVFDQRLIAAFLYVSDDPGHIPGVFLPKGQAASGNGVEPAFGGRGGMPQNFHALTLPQSQAGYGVGVWARCGRFGVARTAVGTP